MAGEVTKIFRPFAAGTVNEWSLGAGASKIIAVDPLATIQHDDDTTYISESQNLNQEERFKPDTSFTEKMGAVVSVTIKARFRDQGSARISNRLRFYIGASQTQSTAFSTTGTTYTEFSEALGRPGGGDWTEADFKDSNFEFAIFTPSQSGPVIRCTSLWFEVVYIPAQVEIPQYTHIATHRLLQRTFDDHRHTLRVPLWLALKLELLDPFNVSHDSLFRSATHLEGHRIVGINTLRPPEVVGDHQLFDKWRRQVVDLISITVDYKNREAILEFQDMEKFITSYFCSEKVVGASADNYPGMAQIDVGGGKVTVERSTAGYIIQDSNIVRSQSRGTFVSRVSPAVAKRNHLGLLCEDASENVSSRAVFDQGLTGYTTTLNSGTITAGTTRKYFGDEITSQSIEVSRPNNSADTYLSTAAMSVAAGDGHRRVAIIYSQRAATNIASWALQRASDSNWWNDSGSGSWQVSFVWNNLTDTYDTTNSLEIASYFQSNAIPATTTTWTVRLGLNAAAIPAGGATVDFGYIGVHKGKRRFSPIPTFGSTVTTAVDTVKNVLEVDVSDPVRQLWWAGHGTIELSYLPEQNVADLADPSKHVLFYVQYGTSGKDFDALVYEVSGATKRFIYERFRDISGTSTFDAGSYNNVDLVKGTTYHITCRNIGTDQELGLASKTMLIRFDAGLGTVNGFEAVATAQHSLTEKHTEVWIGSAPTTGPTAAYSRAMGYIWDVKFQPRVLTDEESRE